MFIQFSTTGWNSNKPQCSIILATLICTYTHKVHFYCEVCFHIWFKILKFGVEEKSGWVQCIYCIYRKEGWQMLSDIKLTQGPVEWFISHGWALQPLAFSTCSPITLPLTLKHQTHCITSNVIATMISPWKAEASFHTANINLKELNSNLQIICEWERHSSIERDWYKLRQVSLSLVWSFIFIVQ